MLCRACVVTLVVVACGVGTAQAQRRIPIDTTPDPDEVRNIYTFQVENDFFNPLFKTDRDYTNGLRIGWLSPALPELPDGLTTLLTLPTFFGEAPGTSVTRRVGISLGQNLYTPSDVFTSQPILNDRPYAAWLYAGFAIQSTYKRYNEHIHDDEPVRLDTLELDLGLVGPAAGGEFVQNNFHALIGDQKSFGWANQLHNEPTLDLIFERRWQTGHRILLDNPRLEWDLVPSIGAELGNVADYARAGGLIRIGKELRNDFGPPRSRPAMPGSEGFIGTGFGWYFFLGVGGEAVARNMFLDGNWDGNDIVHVTHRPFVGEGQVGLAFLFRGVRITWSQVLRTPEFFERDRWDQFGSINVTFRY